MNAGTCLARNILKSREYQSRITTHKCTPLKGMTYMDQNSLIIKIQPGPSLAPSSDAVCIYHI